MKSIFFPVVMLVGIAASTVHPAHAGDDYQRRLDDQANAITQQYRLCAITCSDDTRAQLDRDTDTLNMLQRMHDDR
jgi:hypothetical protein